MEITSVQTNDLIPYVRNARTHSEDQIKQIAASIREFGWTNPILIKSDLTVIAGHGRLAAAKLIGMNSVPCIVLDGLSDAQCRALIIADNKLALNAGWDMDILAQEIFALKDLDFDLPVIGFFDDELNGLLDGLLTGDNTVDSGDVVEDDFDADRVAAEIIVPTTQIGDTWVLGNHLLLYGDCTISHNIETLMNGSKADMILTDPPYNVNYTGKTIGALKLQNDNQTGDNFYFFLTSAFSAANNSLKDGGVFYIWHAETEGYTFRAACNDIGWKVRQCLIWNKNSIALGRQDYQWKHEPCLYGWKDGAAHLWASDRTQTTVLDFNRPIRNAEHPTMKPVKLFDYLIRNNTHRNAIVLDFFAGSGTTIIASEQNGRKAMCMELEPAYCDVIVKRWEMLTGQKAYLQRKYKPVHQVLKS